MNNLIFVSSSFNIYNNNNNNNNNRQNLYYFCIKQLLKVIPNNFDIVICDNTIQELNDLNNNNLKEILNIENEITKKVNLKFIILKRSIGKKNIGMGELDELIYISEQIDFNNYNKIVYFTGRRIITNPWIFEQVNIMKKNALISNPPILHINNNYNFKYSKPTENLYNDMFFALSSELMLKYVEYSKLNMDINLNNGIGSEQNLYNFININNIDYEYLKYLGLIRIDYKANNELQLI